ncbi:MAG: hypothetical protein AVDCRST_MAG40-2585, partial [uncultured Gemmatimonadaceae bacterium]
GREPWCARVRLGVGTSHGRRVDPQRVRRRVCRAERGARAARVQRRHAQARGSVV